MRPATLAAALLSLLAACAAPEQAQRGSSAIVEDPRLSASGPSREAADQACRAEAERLQAALPQRANTNALSAAFSQLAACRQARARAVIAEYQQGAIQGSEAAAILVGLRGAMRRDADRVEAAIFNQPSSDALRAELTDARNRQAALVLNAS